MSNIFKILFLLGLLILIGGLATLNSDRRVTVTYLPSASIVDAPVFMVILASMFIGVLIAGLVSAVDQARNRRRIRELEGRMQALRAELRQLRNLPIGEGLEKSCGSGGALGDSG